MDRLGAPVIITQPSAGDGMKIIHRQSMPRYSTFGLQKTRTEHLEKLTATNRVVVKQKIELMDVVLGCETENKYDILDDQNQVIFKVDETSDFCMRCWCGPLRPISVDVQNEDGNSLIAFKRGLGCQDCCFPCCLQFMTVMSPPGQPIGSIIQKWNLRPELHVYNAANQTLFIVKGPMCQFSWKCGDVEFPIFASDGVSECGLITKRWRGMLQELFTDAEIFGIKFPPRIDVTMKALLIGATFLVDYMYFEESQSRRRTY